MDRKIRWLEASFMAGAVADAAAGVLLLIPSRMGEAEFRYPMGFAASLMFGWTVLLLWGYRKPVERRGLLLITIVPAIAGLIATGVYQAASGAFPWARVAPSLILCVLLAALFGFSLWNARDLDRA